MKLRALAVAVVAGALSLGTAAGSASAHTLDSINGTGRLSTNAAAKPATLAPKAAVGFQVRNALCFSNAITFTAETFENGRSGVQQFRQQAREQVFTTAGWRNITPTTKVKSQKFPNDARNFSFTFDWRATHPANGASYRVIWQGFYLNGAGAAIFKTKPIAINCL